MSTRNIEFTPLAKVPATFMNRVQDWGLVSRANEAINTLAAGLDSPSTAHNAKKIVFSLSNAAAFVAVDTSIDWRDRNLSIMLWVDPRDIRPGEADDNKIAYAMWRLRSQWYTGAGNIALPFSTAPFTLTVNLTGHLVVQKPTGYYAHGVIEATPQIKERS